MIWAIPFFHLVLAANPADPYHLNKPHKLRHIKTIIKYADRLDQDPYELLAIAITESNLRPKVISSAGAVGLFQVMCKYWYQRTGHKSIAECNKELLKPHKSTKAGIKVLTTYRKNYEQCKGDLAYRCYFAGQGWRKCRPRTQKKIIRYEKKVRQRREVLHKYYEGLIEDIRSSIKKRS